MKKKPDTYAQDGVDVKEGDSFSAFAGKVCQESWGNSPCVQVRRKDGHFRGTRLFRFRNLPEGCWMDASTDGNGTKVALNSALDLPETAPWDLVAMSATDIARFGGFPLVLLDDLNVATLGKQGDSTNAFFRRMIQALGQAAKAEHLVIWRGETAELGQFVGGLAPDAEKRFLWGSAVIGAMHEKNEITGDALEPGQIVMAMEEFGLRANGLSTLRKALEMRFGPRWWLNPEAQAIMLAAAFPSVPYAYFLAETNGWTSRYLKPKVKMNVIAHISGGGIRDKFGADVLFKRGLSAELTDLFDPPPVMKECAEWRGLTDEEFYGTWNGGQGILAVVDNEKAAEAFSAWAYNYYSFATSQGLFSCWPRVKIVGRITKETKPQLRIKSKFSGREFTYYPDPE